jgi:hypothetical protein
LRELIGKLLASQIYKRPIFIEGASRSGTSVLLQAIGKHRHILSTTGEAPLLTSIGGIVHLFEYENLIVRKYYNESLKFEKKYLYDRMRGLSFEIACGSYWGAKFLVKKLIENPNRFAQKKRWAAKTFPNEKVAKGLLHLFPQAKFVHIVRNGLEVVGSLMRFRGFRDRSFDENCRRWKNNICEQQYLKSLDAAITVKHEDLVGEPQTFFSRIFHFLGEPDDRDVSKFVSRTIVHPLDQPTQTTSIGVKQEFLSRKPAYLKWTQEERKTFKDVCSEAMDVAGYDMPF